MEEECDLAEEEHLIDCPSLLCEELGDVATKNEQGSVRNRRRREEEIGGVGEDTAQKTEEEKEKKAVPGKEVLAAEGEEKQVRLGAVLGVEEAQEVQVEDGFESNKEAVADEQEGKERKDLEERDEKKKSRKRRGRKQSERVRNTRGSKCASEQLEEKNRSQTQEVSAMSSEDSSALSEPSIGLMNSCDLTDPVHTGCGATGMYCPPVPVPVPLLFSSQPPAPIQQVPSQPHGTKRPHSPLLPHTLPQLGLQPFEMEKTQVNSTRRSVRHSTRGRVRPPSLPGLESVDNCILPPPPKKKTRTLYSTDQLEHLEALFQEDHYPDAEKRKLIAASVGVTPQRIMVWFQNRRAKWRKAERSRTSKVEYQQSRAGCSSSSSNSQLQQLNHPLPTTSMGVPSSSGNYGSKPPQLPSAPPSFPTLSSQTLPTYSNLLAGNSPGQSRGRDGGQNLYYPRPMHSPPPVRRVTLPLFATNYNSSNYTPPLHFTLAHTPPLFHDSLEGGSSLSHHDTLQALQSDTSSLFDFGEKFDYLTSSQQNNTLPYQLQTSYPSSQHQPQTSLPRMSYLTPTPYLTPNAPDSNPTSYLTFGPTGTSTGMVTYSTGGHSFFQSQNTGQILLQSAGHHGGIAAYQSYPWGSLYTQTALHHQRAQCPSAFPSSSAATLPPPSFFTLGEPESSHANSQDLSHAHTHSSSTSSTTISTSTLPPVTTLQPTSLRAEITPSKDASFLPSQVSPASSESPPAPPCVKIEYDSPQEIHSHFHCDFSTIHF